MSKLIKFLSGFIACGLLTVSAFASVDEWSSTGYEDGISITKKLLITSSKDSRSFSAITKTDCKADAITSTVTVVRQSNNGYVGTDTWTETDSFESEAFYSV